ncbi:MAG: M1 family metallopeptidase [bacterium]
MIRFSHILVAFVGMMILSETSQGQLAPLVRLNQMKSYDVKSYKATIWLDRKQNTISGWVEMNVLSMGEITEIVQHAKFIEIDSVFVDDAPATFLTPDSDGMYKVVGFPGQYHNGSNFTVKTYYHGKGMVEEGTNKWGGVHNEGNMMFAMGVGFNAPYVSCTRHWLPCFDEPDDKADSVTLRFFADTSGIVVSNGLLTGYLAGTDGGKTNFYEWKITHPIATYLLTFAFGPFQKLSIKNPLNIPFDVYSFAKDTAKARTLMEKRVVKALVYFDSLFGEYPFEKVGYVIAPIGSMEHQTMITLVNSVLDTNNTTAVHELAHQWWGDKTTCFDFNEPWLNEGFATYSEALFQERFSGEKAYWQTQHSNIASALTKGQDTISLFGAPYYTHPRNNYPPVIYNKGAAVLGMLRYTLGDANFFTGLRAYGKYTAYSNATTEDFQGIVEDTLMRDLRYFVAEWMFGIGHPAITVTWSKHDSTVRLQMLQTQDSVRIGFFRQPIIVEARTFGGKSERHEVLLDTLRISEASFQNSFIPDSIVFDPDGAIIKKLNGAVKLGAISSFEPEKIPELRFVPNPSNATHMIAQHAMPSAMSISSDTQTRLLLYDTQGNEVRKITPESEKMDSGTQLVQYFFSTEGLESGTYFALLMLNDKLIAKGQFVFTK